MIQESYLRGPAVDLAVVAPRSPGASLTGCASIGATTFWEGDVFMASVCIGLRVGGAFYLAPQARNDDCLIDPCFAVDVGLLRILALLPRPSRGSARSWDSHAASPTEHYATSFDTIDFLARLLTHVPDKNHINVHRAR